MPNYEKYQHLVDDFNEKYGVNFSYEEFEAEVNALRNSRGPGVGSEIENEVYVNTYKNLFKKAVDNLIHARLGIYRVEHNYISADYEKMMNGYIDANVNEGNFFQTKWIPRSQLAGSMRTIVASYPDTNADYIAQKYLGGEFRIRDMRARTNLLESRKETNPERICAILCYAEALEKVNSQRSFWWRVFHPFRNSAEKSEAKNMRKFVNAVAKEYDRINRKEGAFFNEMQRTVGVNPTAELRDRLDNEISIMREAEEKAEVPKMENNNLNVANENNKENIGKQINAEVNNKNIAGRSKPKTAVEQFNDKNNSYTITGEAERKIGELLANVPGIDKDGKKNEIFDLLIFASKSHFCEEHDYAVSEGTFAEFEETGMKGAAIEMFSAVMLKISDFEIDMADKIVMAQKLSDIFINKFTPVAFYPEKYREYANNYVLNECGEAVLETMETYGVERADGEKILENARNQIKEMEQLRDDVNKGVNNNSDHEIQNERIEDRKLESSMAK